MFVYSAETSHFLQGKNKTSREIKIICILFVQKFLHYNIFIKCSVILKFCLRNVCLGHNPYCHLDSSSCKSDTSWHKTVENILQSLTEIFGKGKDFPKEAEVAQGVPVRLGPRIFLTFGTTRVVGRQPSAPAAFTSG
jgi:hypothetical protein